MSRPNNPAAELVAELGQILEQYGDDDELRAELGHLVAPARSWLEAEARLESSAGAMLAELDEYLQRGSSWAQVRERVEVLRAALEALEGQKGGELVELAPVLEAKRRRELAAIGSAVAETSLGGVLPMLPDLAYRVELREQGGRGVYGYGATVEQAAAAAGRFWRTLEGAPAEPPGIRVSHNGQEHDHPIARSAVIDVLRGGAQ